MNSSVPKTSQVRLTSKWPSNLTAKAVNSPANSFRPMSMISSSPCSAIQTLKKRQRFCTATPVCQLMTWSG
ncbi:hypothetical protein [Glutamicibacter sp. M10]|uniref:hypothetical protein n=1 Tax=Glutamicibacter sp. M10 TaxID=3023076 RepID=UPI0037BEAF46